MDGVALLLSTCLSLLIIGYFLPTITQKFLSRSFAWLLGIISVFISLLITAEYQPLTKMIVTVLLLLVAMKVIVLNEYYEGKSGLNFTQWFAFALGWFGMRPALFEKLPSRTLPWRHILIKALISLVVGLIVLRISIAIELNSFISDFSMLLGLSLILHFGILNVATSGWRLLGVDARELFRAPYRSRSLKEFWGRRWNIAFSEMTALVVYKPLKGKIGPMMAMVIAFLFSGFLHEIAISFPVRTGYGLPFCYFLIHAAVMVGEDQLSLVKRLTANPILGRVWVMSWIILPLPLLFHKAFLIQVLRPLRDFLFI